MYRLEGMRERIWYSIFGNLLLRVVAPPPRRHPKCMLNMRANARDVWYAIQIYAHGNTIPPSFTALEQ
jgi:hypothetical protein